LAVELKAWILGPGFACARVFQVDVGMAGEGLPCQRGFADLARAKNQQRRKASGQGTQAVDGNAVVHGRKVLVNMLAVLLVNVKKARIKAGRQTDQGPTGKIHRPASGRLGLPICSPSS
jgi:hypothetical protein